ncbi:hypothetical protein KJ966_02875 [bacterium]|nr:hypothetical protein [bacterium]
MTEVQPPNGQQESGDDQTARYALVQKIMGKETFIDPLNAEQVTRAYSVYGANPQKIVEVVVEKLKFYCRKCIRETALLEVKNEISQATLMESEKLKDKVVNEMFDSIKKDPVLEQLIVMLIFKNRFWEWIRYGLKEILNDQRSQPGHEINNVLNKRFHTMKKEKNINIVGDLVVMDVTDIVNNFKREVMKKSVKLF